MIDVAIMGHGVVGSGVAEVLTKHPDNIAARAGEAINIKYILDLRDFPESPLFDRFTTDFERIVNDKDVRIVAELMGGLEPAYTFVKRCLLAGKSVVTSNKELVAAKGYELLSIAKAQNVNFLFEASVGGGIPILRPLSQCMAANEIDEIMGILNGTTNFILTKMISENMSFEDALKMAQELGYAEKDPTADVGGHDTCRKVCILAALAFGKHVYPEHIYTEGIENLNLCDAQYASSADYAIKLIGRVARAQDNRITATVYPALVSSDSQLSSVNDVFNAVLVRGDATGDVLFYGKGAGKLPTASAVVADIIDCVKHLEARKYLFWEDYSDGYVCDHNNDVVNLYVRAGIESEQAVTAIKKAFDHKDISLDFLCLPPLISKKETAFICGPFVEKDLRSLIEQIKDIKVISILHVID